MSLSYINRSNDEEIIDILRSVLNNGTAKAETFNEHVLIKLMQIRGTPIENMSFDQERVNRLYLNWVNESKAAQNNAVGLSNSAQQTQPAILAFVEKYCKFFNVTSEVEAHIRNFSVAWQEQQAGA